MIMHKNKYLLNTKEILKIFVPIKLYELLLLNLVY
jgi:hypothetical protein